ncbi:uncharacterized protein CTRU02_213160 [Colletotrichum truncatum]|uniref:Uncharacterized protein n=1 Tax=Colletotrichum truncatum TaxID=5467 RepID=A0ACC3YLY0_COLTU
MAPVHLTKYQTYLHLFLHRKYKPDPQQSLLRKKHDAIVSHILQLVKHIKLINRVQIL